MSESSARGRQSKSAAAKHQKEKKRKKNAVARTSKAKNKAAKKARDQYIATLPKVSEDNLLAFQFAHFGDDSKPDNWFMAKEAAVNFDLDDGLGYYDDGVKRTLTDEQIAVFRRTELWQMKHDQEESHEALRDKQQHHGSEAEAQHGRAASPASEVSSLEDELLAYATVKRLEPEASEPTTRKASQSGRSESTTQSTESWKGRPLQQSISYGQRHKRKWEGYIADQDPIEGSLTHRRLAREMDDQQNEPIEMDY